VTWIRRRPRGYAPPLPDQGARPATDGGEAPMPRLPHERDEQANAAHEPTEVMQRAHDDLGEVASIRIAAGSPTGRDCTPEIRGASQAASRGAAHALKRRASGARDLHGAARERRPSLPASRASSDAALPAAARAAMPSKITANRNSANATWNGAIASRRPDAAR
jgi:hypothetical protein